MGERKNNEKVKTVSENNFEENAYEGDQRNRVAITQGEALMLELCMYGVRMTQ